MKIITLCLLLILTACSDSGESSLAKKIQEAEDILEGPASDEQVDPEDEEVTEQEVNETEETQDRYYFTLFDGKCRNNSGQEGLNPNEFGECGDLSNQNLSDLDFSQKDYWKLNLENSLIENSNVKLGKIAQYEVDYNENTVFADVNNFFTKLFNQHINKMESQKNRMEKMNSKVKTIKAEMAQLMEQYELAVEEKDKKRLERQITKKNKQLEKQKSKAQLAMNRMYRQQKLSGKAYDFASNEDRMTNPKIKNKKWLTINSKDDSIQISPMPGILDDNLFSLSFWFRTNETQNSEGRIVNFLHSGANSSLIFGVHKESVFFGYRDEATKYKRSDYKFNYADGEWHHTLISYQAGKFQIFLDSTLLAEIEDRYLGFGDQPASLGSYRLSSHVFNGDIDEVSAWTTGLSDSDGKELFNDGIMSDLKLHPQHLNLVKWWRLGDKTPRHLAGETVE